MSGTNPQKGIPQTGIGFASSGSQALLSKQGLANNAPWSEIDGTLMPNSYRFLLNVIAQINHLQRQIDTINQRLATAGIP